MARKLADIQREAMQLSRRERAALVESLLATLDSGDDIQAEELWLEESEHRYAEYRAGTISSKPADQVFLEAKKKLQ